MSTTAGPSWQQRVVQALMRRVLRPLLRRLELAGAPLLLLRSVLAVTGWLMGSARFGGLQDALYSPVRTRTGDGARVVGEWVLAPDSPGDPRDGVVLYLHGGGYVLGSPRAARPTTVALSRYAQVPVFAAGYRLAPEHPHPAAFDDVTAAFRWLLDQGVPAGRIVFAGDSAGAHMAISLALGLSRAGEPVPAGVLMYSPVLDPLGEHEAGSGDPLLSPEFAERAAAAVLRDTPLDDPALTLLTGDPAGLAGCPPVEIHVGATEHFRSDGERLHALLQRAGVPSALHVHPHGLHSDVMFGRFIPEAHAALVEGASFVRGRRAATPDHPHDLLGRTA